jgi:glycosyltransferase involved in cell wall biosynthesis
MTDISEYTTDPAPVSVIICSHNDLTRLKSCLEKVLKQAYEQFEVLVVDDRSEDGTLAFLQEQSIKHERLRYIRIDQTKPGWNAKKFALTSGVEQAKYNLILLTDSDCVPVSKHWIRKMAGGFRDGIIFALGYGGYLHRPGWLNCFIRYETLTTAIHYLGLALLNKPYMGVGRNLAYLKDHFQDSGGLEPWSSITGGDDDLPVNRRIRASNAAVRLHPKAVTLSHPKQTWKAYFIQKIRHYSVGRYYRTGDQVILAGISMTQLLFWLSFITLIIIGTNPLIIVPGFIVRMACLTLAFYYFTEKVGERFTLAAISVLDLAYTLIIPVLGLRALTAKHVQWS